MLAICLSLKFFYEWIPFDCRCARRCAGKRIGRPSAGGWDGARKVVSRRVEEESDGGSGGEDEDEDEDEQSGRQASKGAR